MAKIKYSLVKAIIPITMILILALYYLVTSSNGQNITFCEAISVIRHSVPKAQGIIFATSVDIPNEKLSNDGARYGWNFCVVLDTDLLSYIEIRNGKISSEVQVKKTIKSKMLLFSDVNYDTDYFVKQASSIEQIMPSNYWKQGIHFEAGQSEGLPYIAIHCIDSVAKETTITFNISNGEYIKTSKKEFIGGGLLLDGVGLSSIKQNTGILGADYTKENLIYWGYHQLEQGQVFGFIYCNEKETILQSVPIFALVKNSDTYIVYEDGLEIVSIDGSSKHVTIKDTIIDCLAIGRSLFILGSNYLYSFDLEQLTLVQYECSGYSRLSVRNGVLQISGNNISAFFDGQVRVFDDSTLYEYALYNDSYVFEINENTLQIKRNQEIVQSFSFDSNIDVYISNDKLVISLQNGEVQQLEQKNGGAYSEVEREVYSGSLTNVHYANGHMLCCFAPNPEWREVKFE